ncbi:bifunctional adenosylcobinamide kinase/adenosylcobinamide-phosphate guanylyltransferase [Sphingomonas sp. MS122]|uniref:bifunctional adenosylcobinamide kinase/adenosylcobinamide-phosphate guanylyltransferase n=1 Tax=Sphingomonas sp. MS122 TaxID=3412683 RepID=UPI003C2DE2A2
MSTLLVLGGARSGKSSHAQARAEAIGGELVFVATAEASDDEMADRIARHRADRGARWSTIEAPVELAATIRRESRRGRVLLVDCLTLWASNLLLAGRDIPAATDDLAEAIAAVQGPLILVSNEVGLGIVPDNALARRFRDAAGRVNQRVAACADEVVFVAAGLPLKLK